MREKTLQSSPHLGKTQHLGFFLGGGSLNDEKKACYDSRVVRFNPPPEELSDKCIRRPFFFGRFSSTFWHRIRPSHYRYVHSIRTAVTYGVLVRQISRAISDDYCRLHSKFSSQLQFSSDQWSLSHTTQSAHFESYLFHAVCLVYTYSTTRHILLKRTEFPH